MNTQDILYRVQTDPFGELVADFALSDPAELNNKTRGDTTTINLHFTDESLTVASDETYTVASDTTEVYNTVTVNGTLVVDGELVSYEALNNNGTVKNNGTVSVVADGLNTLVDFYDRYAGDFAVQETINSVQKFREQIETGAPIESLVVGIEPAQGLEDKSITGVWGLISNVTDNRTRATTNPVVSVEVLILDRYSAYADIVAVKSDLEV